MTTLPQPSSTPLSVADSLRELFERDPLVLTRPDFERMLTWARDSRARWASEEREARGAGRKSRSKVVALPLATPAGLDPETASL